MGPQNMSAKNTLVAADADLVESVFNDKPASIQSTQASVEEAAGSVAGDGSAKASDQIFVDYWRPRWQVQSSCHRSQNLAAVASPRKRSAYGVRGDPGAVRLLGRAAQ